MGTAISSWSARRHVELVARGSTQQTLGEFLSRRDRTRTEYSKCEPFHGLWMAATTCSRHTSLNGEACGDGASPPLERC